MSSSCRSAAISRWDFVRCSWSEAMRAGAVGRSSIDRVRAADPFTASYDRRRAFAYTRALFLMVSRALIPAAAVRVGEIDPREPQHQIPAAHCHRVAFVLGRPRKRPALEPLVEHPEAAVISRQDLETIGAAIAKQKEMAGQRIEIEALAYERRQAIDRPA